MSFTFHEQKLNIPLMLRAYRLQLEIMKCGTKNKGNDSQKGFVDNAQNTLLRITSLYIRISLYLIFLRRFET